MSEQRRTAFVTGASQGLGQEIAVALARDGCDVAVSSRRVERLSDTLGLIEKAGASVLGAVDALVNNAAVTLRATALEMTRAEWDELMSVNLKGVFFMSQLMGRHLTEKKRPGCIVSLASTHGMLGFAGRSAYGIAKAGIIQMTRQLAIEWADHGIRVNAVAPGTVDTPSRAEFFSANPDAKKAMTDRIPFHRFARPAEIAQAVRYLASAEAAYITGQTLVLDGGLTSY
jgi:NAD(P)-dependent dehydrogenase (short-subunit alcohol dehydrogenase family)